MADQLGIQSIAIPEEYGGAGFGFGELSVVLEEAGRALLCSPLFSTVVLAATTILESGDTEAAQPAPTGDRRRPHGRHARAGRGERPLERGRHRRPPPCPTARTSRISGTKPYVLDGAQADLVIVAARTAAGTSLFTVDAKERGVTATALPTLDQTRRLATLTFDDTPAKLLGVEGQGLGRC